MTAHAVESQTSGSVPLWRRDTPPSEPSNRRLPEPTTPMFQREGGAAVEDALSPPRDTNARDRSSDVSITKVSVPLPMQAAVITVALYIASQLWGISARMDNVADLFEAQQKHTERYQALLEKNVELQIREAGLRTSAMDLATKLSEVTAQLNALKGR